MVSSDAFVFESPWDLIIDIEGLQVYRELVHPDSLAIHEVIESSIHKRKAYQVLHRKKLRNLRNIANYRENARFF